MRDRVLAAIATYQEGGTVQAALKHHRISWAQFYKCLKENSDVETEYRKVQTNRADMYVDSLEDVPTEVEDVRRARVKLDALMAKAKFYDRARFGDKVDVNVNGTVSISGALEAAKSRALPPPRNLGKVIEGQCIELNSIPQGGAPDKVSGARPVEPASSDPAGIFDDD